jgi:hypothetical protein
MNDIVHKTALAGLIEFLPTHFVTKDLRANFAKLESGLDQLVFMDQSGELSFDRKAFLDLVKDEALVPRQLRDIVVLETSKHLGRRLRTRKRNERRVRWRDSEQHRLLGKSAVDDLRRLGIGPATTEEKLSTTLAEHYPDLPVSLFSKLAEPDGEEWLIERFEHNLTVWDCAVANLGWFAAIMVAGSLILLIILVAAAVSGGWIALLLLAFAGTLTTYVLAQCILNPAFRQFG